MYRQSIAATCRITRVLQVSSCIVENLIRSPTSFTLLVMSSHLLLTFTYTEQINKININSIFLCSNRSAMLDDTGAVLIPVGRMNAEEGFSTQTDLFRLRPIYSSSRHAQKTPHIPLDIYYSAALNISSATII